MAAIILSVAAWGQDNQNPKQSVELIARDQTNGQQPAVTPDVLRSLFDEAAKIFANEKAANETSEQRKERREVADLDAQLRMASWAGWALVLTAIQIPIGALTLWFLWLNFAEARKTANAAILATNATVESNSITQKIFEES